MEQLRLVALEAPSPPDARRDRCRADRSLAWIREIRRILDRAEPGEFRRAG